MQGIDFDPILLPGIESLTISAGSQTSVAKQLFFGLFRRDIRGNSNLRWINGKVSDRSVTDMWIR